MRTLLVDTGVFVALLSRRDAHHEWARACLAGLPAASTHFVTCEAVLTEAFHLVESRGGRRQDLLRLLGRLAPAVRPAWDERVETLMQQYQVADFADACLVHLYDTASGEPGEATIFTADRDFFVYRDVRGEPLRVLHPDTHPA